MELSAYELDEATIIALASIEESPAAIAILEVAKKRYDKEVSKLRDGLVGVSNDNPRNDFRHSIGTAGFAAEILKLRGEAIKLQQAKQEVRV